jgi:CheY-like chemotaxis protein
MSPTVVQGARPALAALEGAAARGEPYPLVLLDAMMPETDGFTLAGQINSHPGLARSTVMMLSSADRPGDAARCRGLGVAGYLTKPVKPSELLDALVTALAREGHEPGRTAAGAGARAASCPWAAPPRGGPVRGLRVLLAEDNLVNQRLALRLLEKQGHTVRVAGDGEEALAALEAEPFDALLLDVQLPGADGFEVAAQVRARERHGGGHLPIIAMTAHALAGDRERCLRAGMDGYLAKPVVAQELFRALADVAGEGRSERAGSRG